MKQNSTEITIVLDRSGSMDSIRKDTIGGVNRFIQDQRNVPGEARLTICLFDDEYSKPVNGENIHAVKLLDESSYQPRGNTCLLGAIGTAIRETGERLEKLPESERPEHVVVVIVTDGEENSSYRYEWSRSHNNETVRKQIEHQSSVYNWKFVYIGANQDAFANAQKIGVQRGSTLNYAANAAGTKNLYGALSANLSALRSNQADGMAFSASQRKEQDQAKLTS